MGGAGAFSEQISESSNTNPNINLIHPSIQEIVTFKNFDVNL